MCSLNVCDCNDVNGYLVLSAFVLKFRLNVFFTSQIRRLIGDFGVPIAIFLMVVIDFNIDDTYTQVSPRLKHETPSF